jgi:hypothetical protein
MIAGEVALLVLHRDSDPAAAPYPYWSFKALKTFEVSIHNIAVDDLDPTFQPKFEIVRPKFYINLKSITFYAFGKPARIKKGVR